MKTANNNNRLVGKARQNTTGKSRSPQIIATSEDMKSIDNSSADRLKPDKRNKHVVLNQHTLKQAQSVLGARTETETIEKALAQVIANDHSNRAAGAANEEFIRNMTGQNLEIIDVYGRLDRS